MPNLQSIANNIPKLIFLFYPPFEYPVLHSNFDQHFNWPVLWFLKGLSWIFWIFGISETNQKIWRTY